MMEGDSKPPPPFLQRTYEMVDDPWTDAIVSWSLSGLSFVVWNPLKFATDLLPKHFKHNNFSSFIRQLNTYGFRKVDPEQWEFSNEEFVRGRIHLLRNIRRRKPVYRHNKAQSDPERDEFLRKIKSLEQENRSLHSDLEKYRLHNREYETHLRFLWQVLNDIDQRQRKLMAGLSQFPESPSKRRRLTHSRDEYRELSMGLPEDKDVVESLDLNGCLYDDNSGNNCSSDDSYLSDSLEPAPESPLLPPISSICMDLEMVDKLDENETVDSRLVDLDSARPAGGADVGANDVFWQQFLNEGPDSWVMQAVQ